MTHILSPDVAGLRALGHSGLAVRPLALGGNAMGWTVDEPTTHAILDRFTDAGFALVDTADTYSQWVPGHVGGESERIIGNWVASRGRDRIVIATKVGAPVKSGEKGLSPANIARAVEGSLQRLRTDYIDLYQAHFDDPDVPLAETLGAFGELIAQGKVRAIGLSNYTPARFREALDVARAKGLPRFEMLQPLYNLYDRAAFETDYAPICEAEGIGVMNYYALASGFLTGKYRSMEDVKASKRQKSNERYFTPRGLRILDALDRAAARTGATPAKVAMAWLVAQPLVTAPIASATSLLQLEDLIASVELRLDDAVMADLNAASAL